MKRTRRSKNEIYKEQILNLNVDSSIQIPIEKYPALKRNITEFNKNPLRQFAYTVKHADAGFFKVIRIE